MAKASIITDEHYKGIGEIMVTWARLESSFIDLLAAMLDTGISKSILTFWHMGFKERMTRVNNLFCLKHEDPNSPERREFDTLERRLQKAEDIRNIAAHSIWFKGTKPGAISPLIIKAKGGSPKFTGHGLPPDEFTAERFHKEAEKIDRLGEDFKDFFSAHYTVTFKLTKKRL